MPVQIICNACGLARTSGWWMLGSIEGFWRAVARPRPPCPACASPHLVVRWQIGVTPAPVLSRPATIKGA